MALIMHRLALLTAGAQRSILESDSKIVRLERAMVDFSLTDEERQIRDTVRAFIRNEVMPLEPDVLRNERAGRQGVDPEVLRDLRMKARKAGFWGVNTPEEYGGMNLGPIMSAILEMECGRSFVPFSFGGRADNILYVGTEEQKRRYLIPTIEGERRSCFAITEPDAGSDARNIRTRARRDGDEWVISGEKTFITGGNEADFVIVFAVTDPDKGADGGISCFLADRDMGWKSAPIQTMGQWGPAALVFDEVRVPDGNVLGEVGQGFELAMRWIGQGRYMIPGGPRRDSTPGTPPRSPSCRGRSWPTRWSTGSSRSTAAWATPRSCPSSAGTGSCDYCASTRAPTRSSAARSPATSSRATSGSARSEPELAAPRHPAHEGRLAGVLEVVADDAHQPHAQRHRRVPCLVDDAAQVGVAETLEIADRLLVDGVVVAQQQLLGGPHGGDLVGPVPVAGVQRVQRQAEPLDPVLRGPDLLDPRGVGDVVVLDARQVPDQPGDRVGPAVDPQRQLLRRQALDHVVDDLTDPAERVDEQIGAGHWVDSCVGMALDDTVRPGYRRSDRDDLPAGPSPLRRHAVPPGRSQRAAAARGLAGPVAELRARPPARRPAGGRPTRLRPGDHPLRPGQQLRAAVRVGRGELRPHARHRPARPSGRAGRLHQGRLRHVAGAVRRVGLAQVPARQPRPEPRAHGPGLRGHLLLAPVRPGDAAGGDARCAGLGGAAGQGALRGRLVLFGGADHGGGRDPARPRHPPAHPPALLLVAEPLDRGRPARRARRGGRWLHRVLAARAGCADRPLPRRHPQGVQGEPAGLAHQ